MSFRVIETHEYMRTGEVETTAAIDFDNDLEGVTYVLSILKDMTDVAEGRRTPRFFNPLSITIERV